MLIALASVLVLASAALGAFALGGGDRTRSAGGSAQNTIRTEASRRDAGTKGTGERKDKARDQPAKSAAAPPPTQPQTTAEPPARRSSPRMRSRPPGRRPSCRPRATS
ncbi:MAG: hypothetical protein R2736_04975 [Solirubrobacterales bacterium]